MTIINLSSNTVALINNAINGDPGANHSNFLNAYTAIYNDIKDQQGVDPGTVTWFSMAGLVNTQLSNPTAAGTWIHDYMFAAAKAEGVTLNDAIFQKVSDAIALTVFNQLKGGVFDTSAFSPQGIVKTDAGSGIRLLQSLFPNSNLSYAIWGGTLFATGVLHDPTYFSDYNIDTSNPSTRDCQAVAAGFLAAATGTVKYLLSNAGMATQLDVQTVAACMVGGQVFQDGIPIFQPISNTSSGAPNFTPVWSDIIDSEARAATDISTGMSISEDASTLASEFNLRRIDSGYGLTLGGNSIAELVSGGGNLYSGDLLGINDIYDFSSGGNVISLSGGSYNVSTNGASGDAEYIAGNGRLILNGNSGTVNVANGSSADVSGGANTINAAAGSTTHLSDTGGLYDIVNANKDAFGGTTASGQGTGIWLDPNVDVNVNGNGNGINVALGSSVGIGGGDNTIYAASGTDLYLTGTTGGSIVYATNDAFGTATAGGGGSGIWLTPNALVNVQGNGNGINVGQGGTAAIGGGGNTIYAASGSNVYLAGTSGNGDIVNATNDAFGTATAGGNGSGIWLTAGSQASIQGNGNGISVATGSSMGAFGGGNTINAAAGSVAYVSGTNGTYDIVNANGDAFGATAANGQGSGVWLDSGVQTNVYGNNNGISVATGASMGAFGGGNIINAAAGSVAYVSGTNGTYDIVNANGDAFGATAANGQGSGIWLDSGVQTNVFGNNNGISVATGASMGAFGGGNTINASAGSVAYVSGTNGTYDIVNANGDAFGSTAANGQATGVWLDTGSQVYVNGDNNGVSAAAYSQVILTGNYTTVNGAASDVFGLTGVGYNVNLISDSNSFVNFDANSTGSILGSGNTIGVFGANVQVDSDFNKIVLSNDVASGVATDATVVTGNGNDIDASNVLYGGELIVITGDNNVIHANGARIVIDSDNPNSNQIIGSNNRVGSSTGIQNLGNGGVYVPPPPPWQGVGSPLGSRPPSVPAGVSIPQPWEITVSVTITTKVPSNNPPPAPEVPAAAQMVQSMAAFAPQSAGSLNMSLAEAPQSSIFAANTR